MGTFEDIFADLGTNMIANFEIVDGKAMTKENIKNKKITSIISEMTDISNELDEIPSDIVKKWIEELSKTIKEN